MKKVSLVLMFIFMLLLVSPFNVLSASYNSDVGTYLSVSQCTSSKYQDDSFYSSDGDYFSHCIKATCSEGSYKLEYNNTSKSIICSNGNKNPYYKLHKSGCEPIEQTRCNNGHITYCSLIMYYDCSKDVYGNDFVTQTQTQKPTYKPRPTQPQTQPQTVPTPSNTKLKSLSFSSGTIDFSSDVYKYKMNVDNVVSSVDVVAVPEDEKSKVEYTGNTDLKDGSEINITVTGEDGSKSVYLVTVVKKEVVKLSSNTRLESIEIKDYTINFNPRITAYTLPIGEGVTELEVNAKPEDKAAVVTVNDNSNLKNGSKITITVTAEDGSIGYYYINVAVKKKSNFIKILFFIIIILALVAGGYYIYKKYMDSKGGDKYEYE